MPGIDKAPTRVVAVIVLLIVAAAALHGYLPGAEPPPRDRPTGGFGSLFAVVAMLAVSMAIIAIAIITQSRRPSCRPGAGEPPRELAGERRPLTWRMVLIAVGVVIAWLLLVALLSRLNAQFGVEQPPPDAGTPPSGLRPVRDGAAGSRSNRSRRRTSSRFSPGRRSLLMMLVFVGAVIAGRRQRRARDSADFAPATNTGRRHRRTGPIRLRGRRNSGWPRSGT